MSQRASHFDAIPLCYSHHRGPDGFHGLGKRAFIRRYGIDETILLQETKRMLQVAA